MYLGMEAWLRGQPKFYYHWMYSSLTNAKDCRRDARMQMAMEEIETKKEQEQG